VDRLLHELRSTLARLKGEIELLAVPSDKTLQQEIRTSIDDVLRLLTELETATSERSGGQSQGLVIIDDDIRLATAMVRQLTRLGFVATAQQSLEGLASRRPRGTRVVIDLGVLRKSDREDLEIVRTLGPIVMTGSADPLARLEASSYGATAFFIKPVSPEAVAAAIRGPQVPRLLTD